MVRSIPTLRQLIEIEKMVWSEYKKKLKTKNEKKVSKFVFDNAKFITSNPSFANGSMSIEAIMNFMILHHYKTLVVLSSNNMNEAYSIEKDIVKAEIYTPYCKVLVNKNFDE